MSDDFSSVIGQIDSMFHLSHTIYIRVQVLKSRHFPAGAPGHIHTDLLKWLPKEILAEVHEVESTVAQPFTRIRDIIMRSPLLPRAPCVLHPARACPREIVEPDIAGTPCKEYSALGSCWKEQGIWVKVLLVWAKIAKEDGVRVVVHENTPRFVFHVLVDALGDDYEHIALANTGPSDVGVHGVPRSRRLDSACM